MGSSDFVSIFFLACAIFFQLSTTCKSECLDYYDADRELKIIKEWYAMIKTPLDETTAMEQLKNEAQNVTGKPGTNMFKHLKLAINSKKHVYGLTNAECLVVTMYTRNYPETAFYKEYNIASKNRNWQPYRVYTTLLMSAIRKLAKIQPVPQNKPLYRGISFRSESPKAKRIFWKTFISTSLDLTIAKDFAGPGGTLLEFMPSASFYAAQMGNLSLFPKENEVLLIPFQVFEFQNVRQSRLIFSVSKEQKLLQNTFRIDTAAENVNSRFPAC